MTSTLKSLGAVGLAVAATGQVAVVDWQHRGEYTKHLQPARREYVDAARKKPVAYLSMVNEPAKLVVTHALSEVHVDPIKDLFEFTPDPIGVVHADPEDDMVREDDSATKSPTWMCRAVCFMDIDKFDDDYYVLGDLCVKELAEFSEAVAA
jgi:hypothetical protein